MLLYVGEDIVQSLSGPIPLCSPSTVAVEGQIVDTRSSVYRTVRHTANKGRQDYREDTVIYITHDLCATLSFTNTYLET